MLKYYVLPLHKDIKKTEKKRKYFPAKKLLFKNKRKIKTLREITREHILFDKDKVHTIKLESKGELKNIYQRKYVIQHTFKVEVTDKDIEWEELSQRELDILSKLVNMEYACDDHPTLFKFIRYFKYYHLDPKYINWKCLNYGYPIQWAVCYNNYQVLNQIVKHNADYDINKLLINGLDLLHYSIKHHYDNCALILTNHYDYTSYDLCNIAISYNNKFILERYVENYTIIDCILNCVEYDNIALFSFLIGKLKDKKILIEKLKYMKYGKKYIKLLNL